jgi:hypothetical protein
MAHALAMPSIFTPVAGDQSDGGRPLRTPHPRTFEIDGEGGESYQQRFDGRLALPVYRCDRDFDDVSGL